MGPIEAAQAQQALRDAAAAKIEVGFAHPSFDLWLLLHFQPFAGAQSGSSKLVIEKLRNAIGAEAFKDDDKRNEKSVKGTRRDALRGREKTASDNARALIGTCARGACKAAQSKTDPVDRDTPTEPAARAASSSRLVIVCDFESLSSGRRVALLG